MQPLSVFAAAGANTLIACILLLMGSVQGVLLPSRSGSIQHGPRHLGAQQSRNLHAVHTPPVPQLLVLSGDDGQDPEPSLQLSGRRLLNIGALTTTEFIVVIVLSVAGLLLFIALGLLIYVCTRKPTRAQAVPVATYSAAMEKPISAATGNNNFAGLPHDQGKAAPPMPPPLIQSATQQLQQQQQQQQLQQQLQQQQQHLQPAPQLQSTPNGLQDQFLIQQQQFEMIQQAKGAEQLQLRGRGPTLDASILVQRLINNGEHEAAMTVANAAGITYQVPNAMPGSMVGYNNPVRGGVYLPPLQQYNLAAQGGTAGVQRPIPYAAPHTLLA